MSELIFEVGCEDLPPAFVDRSLAWLKENAALQLNEARLTFTSLECEGTPRRLALMVTGLSMRQPDVREEILGPKADIAFASDGTLTPAALGFLKKNGASPNQAYKKETQKGVLLAVSLEKVGQDAFTLLPSLLERLITQMPCPKAMRWDHSGLSFARPIRNIVAIFNGRLLPMKIGDVHSTNTTHGHRFLLPEVFEVSSVHEYLEHLKRGHVMLQREQRRTVILEAAEKLAHSVGGELAKDDALLSEVCNLVEYPWVYMGHFEQSFLQVPKEILVSEMKKHQRYFAVYDKDGALMPYFVFVSAISSSDSKALAEGNARVLRARFEDGAFYFHEDLKVSQETRAQKLASVTFLRELGTLKEKNLRIERLTDALLHGLIGAHFEKSVAADAMRAAVLCKSDLASGVVLEFPELQGIMGRTYALRAGEKVEVARAIEEHYWPRFADDELPSQGAGTIVAMADRLDSLVGLIGVGKLPKGNADPFALRRAALGLVRLIVEKGYSVSLSGLIDAAANVYGAVLKTAPGEEIREFILGRAKAYFMDRLERQGSRHTTSIVDGAMKIGADDLSDTWARIRALSVLCDRDMATFALLVATLKRANNIVQKARTEGQLKKDALINPALLGLDAEKNLLAKVTPLETSTREAGHDVLAREGHYVELLTHIAHLKSDVDRFFNEVMVMTDDLPVRESRLCLLAKVEAVTRRVADFTHLSVD
jgi:glycyl-tRNA synthetase beta chain